MFRSLTLIAAAGIAAAFYAVPASAQTAGQTAAPPADLHPPINLDADTLRARFASGQLGLKPNSSNSGAGSGLPYGIDYNREAKSLVVPLDEKSGWGVGVGLNMNSSKIIELSPGSVLGLQPANRAPGLMLHGKF